MCGGGGQQIPVKPNDPIIAPTVAASVKLGSMIDPLKMRGMQQMIIPLGNQAAGKNPSLNVPNKQ